MVGAVLLSFGNRTPAGAIPAAPGARRTRRGATVLRTVGGERSREPRDARRGAEGDEFVVNGQKVWTRTAHFCDFAILLTRTNATRRSTAGSLSSRRRAPHRHRRSALAPDHGAPAHFNEVFLTDVRVPIANVIGEIDQGWAPARAVLAHEVVWDRRRERGRAQLRHARRARTRHAAAATTRSRGSSWRAAYTREEILRFLNNAWRRRRRSTVGDEDPVVETRRDRALAAVALLGAEGRCSSGMAHRVARAVRRQRSVGARTRSTALMIGERVLGLPPEPRVDRDALRIASWRRGVPEPSESYRINEDPDQVRREHDRLRVLARVVGRAGRGARSPKRASRPGGTAATWVRRGHGRGVDGRAGRGVGARRVDRCRHAVSSRRARA